MTDTNAHIVVRDVTMAYGSSYVVQQIYDQPREVFIIMGGSGCISPRILVLY